MIILVTLFTFNFLIISISAQVPFKGDNTILFVTDKQPEDNFKIFGQYLVTNGFSFDMADREFMMIKTAPKTALNNRGKQSSLHYRFTITFKENEVIIKPEVELVTVTHSLSWNEWEFFPTKGNFMYMYWMNNFRPILEGFEGKKEIRYIKK